METTWIVTANAGEAHVYATTHSNPPLEEITTLVNPTASLQTADTESDRLGVRSASKSKHSVGQPTTPSGYQPNQSPSEHYAELFARNLAAFLLRSHQQGLVKSLTISASPEFLGVLRQLLDPSLESVITTEINKDYTLFRGRELCALIDAHQHAA